MVRAREARKAADFYASVFPHSHVGARRLPGRVGGGGELTVQFTVFGVPFIGLNGGPDFKPNGSVSLMIQTGDQAETDRYWKATIGAVSSLRGTGAG